MQQTNFEDDLKRIVEREPCYNRDAYIFLREALEFTQKSVGKGSRSEARHVSGQELLDGIRRYALDMFGPMALVVLQEWGIKSCEDFGRMVFLMVENNLLRKTDQDSFDDFKNGYSFNDAFRDPFLPSSRKENGHKEPTPEKAGV